MNPQETAAAIGPWATAEEAFGLLTVDVPAEHWTEALTAARDGLGLAYFDWLSAVDELAEGFSVAVHLASVGTPDTGLRRVLLRTRVSRDAAVLPSATAIYAGSRWHERETHEMFGIDFTGHPGLETLLLPDGFEGYPLRKEFVLAARVAKAWPGAKEPGESDHHAGDGPAPAARRKMLPPGVPDPNEWGPLAGTLPPVPDRPARGAARAPRAAAAADAPAARPRRTRTVDQGSTSQATPPPAAPLPEAPWQTPTSAPVPDAAPAATPAPAVGDEPEPTDGPAPAAAPAADAAPAPAAGDGPSVTSGDDA